MEIKNSNIFDVVFEDTGESEDNNSLNNDIFSIMDGKADMEMNACHEDDISLSGAEYRYSAVTEIKIINLD